MRKKAEIVREEEAHYERLWYVRHKTWPMPEGTPQSIIDTAEAACKRIEGCNDIEHLQELCELELEYGILVGRLTALRWMLGMDWDEEGILDT